jgi:hypothetical protein
MDNKFLFWATPARRILGDQLSGAAAGETVFFSPLFNLPAPGRAGRELAKSEYKYGLDSRCYFDLLDCVHDLAADQDVAVGREMMAEKHLYTDGTDTVAAENEADADIVWKSHTGEDRDPVFDDPWRMIPDDEMLTISYNVDDGYGLDHPENAVIIELDDKDKKFCCTHKITAKAGSWAKYGKPFLCTTEW